MSKANFLEEDKSILEKSLKIVAANELDEDLEKLFGGAGDHPSGELKNKSIAPPRDFKIVQPTPGLCVKCFKLNTDEKFFINLCHTDGIPPPEDISEDDLTQIMCSDEPSSYRIPLSISQLRITKDKSDNNVDVADIAINDQFFQKCEKSILFRDFLIALILEALSEKYNIQIKADNWIILKNRKNMGKLVSHRVQNRDVKNVLESYTNMTDEQRQTVRALDDGKGKGRPLIQEIDSTETSVLKKKAHKETENSAKIKELISQAGSEIPEHRLVAKYNGNAVEEILAEFHLPRCLSPNEITLDIGEDRILLESMKRGYLFDKFVEHTLSQDKISARFDKATKMLQVKIPVVCV